MQNLEDDGILWNILILLGSLISIFFTLICLENALWQSISIVNLIIFITKLNRNECWKWNLFMRNMYTIIPCMFKF